jgi:hypothetical protein
LTFAKTLAVDRSLVDTTFNVGRSPGLEVDYVGERVRLRVNVNDGAEALGVSALSTGTDFAAAMRVETTFFGESWPQFEELRPPHQAEPGGLVGAAVFYQKNSSSAASPDDERIAVTADVSTQLEHGEIFASVIWNYVDPGTPGAPSMSQLGVVIQGGVEIVDRWEVFGRYEWSDFDSAGVANLSVVTVGAVRYFLGYKLKWTTDVGVGLNPVAPAFAAPSAGWRADAPGEDGQVVFRSQLQIVF